ncbi:hypothetical protein [Salinisphaera shabanensis]|uniref:hypothetical protein n=1 Tax=Salinisphaera shabanensis TaxID=180542 RepID=UPI00334201E6
MDKLEEILLAVEGKKSLPIDRTQWPVIRLISFKTFNRSDYHRIRWFQSKISEFFQVQLIAIGGGYGCTKISFAVEARTVAEAQRFILTMLGSEEFRNLGVEAEFRVAISNEPYIRSDLKTGKLELSEAAKDKKVVNVTAQEVLLMGKDTNITKIEGGVSNSNLAIGSGSNTLQLNHQPEFKALIELLHDMRSTVDHDSSISPAKKQEAKEQIEAATDEAKKEKPKKSLLKLYAESLKSIDSISSSAKKLLVVLGVVA